MVTVHRAHGLRFVIFANDHVPAHIHVFGDGEARIDIAGAAGEPALVWSDGLSRAELRKAMREVADRQDMLLRRWKDIHG